MPGCGAGYRHFQLRGLGALKFLRRARLGDQVRAVAIAAAARGLAGVAGLGVHRGDHPVWGDPARDPAAPVTPVGTLCRLHILPGLATSASNATAAVACSSSSHRGPLSATTIAFAPLPNAETGFSLAAGSVQSIRGLPNKEYSCPVHTAAISPLRYLHLAHHE